jgi:omega-hydroxy-beta-dihydromenaquinone-9 sulfotransferase
MSSATVARPPEQAPPSPRGREWAPRVWQGCNLPAWLRLLWYGRFRIQPAYWYIAFIVCLMSTFHSVLRIVQQLLYGRAIARMPVSNAPIFIVGHWRTGTTWLHELLILDERHNYPTTYECFDPNHFLITEGFFRRWMRFLLPARRPMDNMPAGWERPQEDEFALCMLGLPSSYLSIAFPNRPWMFPQYLDLEGLSPRALTRWKKVYRRFLQALTYKDPRRLVLKSPPHSCRIKVLLEMFPQARFVHIMRDPYLVFASTVHMWRKLQHAHGLQKPVADGLEEQVFTTFQRLYARLEEGKKIIPGGQFHELRYEDLVKDPEGQLRQLYDKLSLGGFERLAPRLRDYLRDTAGYEKNRYEVDALRREEINRRWGDVIRRYGYA